MAEELSDFEFPRPGRPYRYEWKAWTNGKPWKLVAGKDFQVSVETMRTNARSHAAGLGLKVRTAVVDDGAALIVCFTPADASK